MLTGAGQAAGLDGLIALREARLDPEANRLIAGWLAGARMVAHRIWAAAMRNKYGAIERAQKLKYHIQTSGRSLHAHEIDFNDIRTTLQSLTAIYDNCNNLHTNFL